MNMTELHKQIIRMFAECDMKAELTARCMGYHRNTIVYHLDKITDKTGLDPRCFYDLCKLLKAVNSECSTSHLSNNA